MALAVMALLALLGWRGLDGMVRTHEHTRARSQAHAVLKPHWRSGEQTWTRCSR